MYIERIKLMKAYVKFCNCILCYVSSWFRVQVSCSS